MSMQLHDSVAALQVVGGTAIGGEKLFIGNNTKIEIGTDATSSRCRSESISEVVGGAAVGKKLCWW